MVAKFWIKQLLIKPDPSPYLLANKMPAVRLYAAPNEPLYWTNPESVIADTLSGKTLGQSPFELRFDVHSKAITDGTTQLFDAPGLMKCIAQEETLYFKFAWEFPWYSLDKKYLRGGWNPVALVSDGTNITLQVNEYVALLVVRTPDWKDWTMPELASDTDYGSVTYSKSLSPSYSAYQFFTPAGLRMYAYPQSERYYVEWEMPKGIALNIQSLTLDSPLFHDGRVNLPTNAYVYNVDGSRFDLLGYINPWYKTPTASIECPATIIVNQNNITKKLRVSFVGGDQTSSSVQISCNITAQSTRYDDYPQLTVGQIFSPASWTKVRGIKAGIL